MAVEPAQASPVDTGAMPSTANLLARFRQAYRGRHDPEDALFWLEHPDQRGPSGASPPGVAALTLRRQVYGPGSTPVAAGRLRDLQAQQERDRIEARRALSIALTERPPVNAPPETPASREVGPDIDAARGRSIRPLLRTALIALGCVAAGLGVGAAVGLLQPGAGDGVTSSGGAAVPVVATADPSIVQRSSGAAVPSGVVLNPQILPDSVHRLAAVGVDGTALFAARNRLGNVCLLAGRSFIAAACVSPGDFKRSGVTLQWTTDPAGPRRIATWRPDGSVTLRLAS